MARPERQSADYFPFYAKDGRTLFLLESKYKCKGTGFFTNVMRFLTLETHHHVSIQDETDKMYFFSKCHCDEESGMDMLNIMAKTDKINNELWNIKVIASQDLLDSLTDAYRNRKNDIITMDEIVEKYVSDVRNEVSDVRNSQETGVSDAEKPQRKGKEKKETYTSDFELFYKAYPNKKAKANAFKAWKKMNGEHPNIENLLVIIEKQKQSKEWKKDGGQFIPHPTTWLNGKRWEDEISKTSNDNDPPYWSND